MFQCLVMYISRDIIYYVHAQARYSFEEKKKRESAGLSALVLFSNPLCNLVACKLVALLVRVSTCAIFWKLFPFCPLSLRNRLF
jgi:hypothetical protein